MSKSMFGWHVPVAEEMKRYKQLKMEDLTTIREWMAANPHLPVVDDEIICQFMYACYFDMEYVKTAMENFYSYKTQMPEFSKNWDITSPSVRDVGDNLHIALLPDLDSEGNQVIVCKLNNMTPAQYVFGECIKWIMMTVFLCQLEHGIRPGYTIVYDADGYTMSHLFRNPLGQVKNYILFAQTASNIRVTGIKFINSSIVIKQLINLARPFLNQEVMKMLSVHTTHEEYFKTIPKEIVPSDYNGEGPSLAELTKVQKEKLEAMRHILMKHELLCADESKRIKKDKSKRKESKVEELKEKSEEANLQTIESTFKKLDLD